MGSHIPAVFDLMLCRTDEQAPIPTVFDELLNQVSKINGNVDIIFNCQMGQVR